MNTTMDATYDLAYEQLVTTYHMNHMKRFYDPIVKEVSVVLFQLGVRANLKGFRYLRSAIRMTVLDHTATDCMMKHLYLEVAKEYNSTPSRVERSMRTAVESIDPENEYMKLIFVNNWEHYTNREFISMIAEYINRNMLATA